VNVERTDQNGVGDDLVGKRVEVFWPDDVEWYGGKVIGFDNSSDKHCILYDDGEEEELHLPNEQVRHRIDDVIIAEDCFTVENSSSQRSCCKARSSEWNDR
jgi:hypothetical protein